MRQVWRVVGSVRLAVVLLVLIAVASTLGVVLPQPESFNANSFVERRLDPRAEHAVKPGEFLALVRAAGVLGRDRAFETLASKVANATLGDGDWQAFAGMMAGRLRSEELGDTCLRLAYADWFGPALGRLMLAFDIHRLFTSHWFRLLCIVLLVNLAACSIERLPGQWRMAFGLRPSADPAWYRRRATHAELALAGGADAVEAALRDAGFRPRRVDGPQGTVLEASRGWVGGISRLGAQVVHLGVILIAVGGFVSGKLAFRHGQLLARGEELAVPVDLGGESARADWRVPPGEASRPARFRMRLRRFEFRTDSRGKPEYYGSHVTLLDSEPPADLVIEVNRPLVYRGLYAYQQSYQPDYRGITAVSLVVATVRRAEGAPPEGHDEGTPLDVISQVSLAVPPDTPVKVPGTNLTLRVVRYFPHWQIPLEQTPDGRVVAGEARNVSDDPVNPAVQLHLEAPGLPPRQRWAPLPFRAGEPRPGAMIDYGDYRVVPVDFTPDYATYLTFKTHPVLMPVWIGCGVMMLGIVLCFYCNHERVWALVRPREGGGAEVCLAGDSFKWRERFRERFDRIVASLTESG